MLNDLYTFLERVPWPALLIFGIIAVIVGIVGNVRGWWYSSAAIEKLEAAHGEEVAVLKESASTWKQLALTNLQINRQVVDTQSQAAEFQRQLVATMETVLKEHGV